MSGREALRRARKLPIGDARNDLRQVALGLRWLEKRGYVDIPQDLVRECERRNRKGTRFGAPSENEDSSKCAKMGVRGLLVYCSDCHCSRWTAISGDQWPTMSSYRRSSRASPAKGLRHEGSGSPPEFSGKRSA